MLLYYITDRTQFVGNERERSSALIAQAAEAARYGVNYIQIREKDLPTAELEKLARAIVEQVRDVNPSTRVLINSRTDIALAAGADGVHLRSSDVSSQDVQKIWRATGREFMPVIGVSCHTNADVAAAAQAQATFAVFGPVFEKAGSSAAGIEALRSACQSELPVLALGGVTTENARLCVQAGAAGIAGIRLFQQGDLKEVVEQLRRI